MKRSVIVALSLIVLLGAFFVGARAWRAQQAEQVSAATQAQPERFAPETAMRLGDPAARVVVVEFFDPACETCAQFAPIVKDMVESSGGRIQLVVRYAPFHEGSRPIVALLEAARRQDLYWQAVEVLFVTQPAWASHHTGIDRAQAETILGGVGLDLDRLRRDAMDPAITALIDQDMKDVAALGVKATPEFFVNGKPLPTWGLRQLQELVASELDANY